MSGFDDHVTVVGDWMALSPSPRTFFSSMLNDDVGFRSISESMGDNRSGALFPGHEANNNMSRNIEGKDNTRAHGDDDQATNSGPFSEQKMISRGGLLERMAARAGFNAPRLNTESVRPADLSQNPEIRSPYLTIPPGLSPTTLLDSPVFLSNSLVQQSPTTGKIQFAPSGISRSSMRMMEGPDKSKDNFFENMDTSSFAFKPVPESSPSLFLGPGAPSTLPQQSFQANFSRSSVENETGGKNVSSEHSPPLDEQQDEDADQIVSGDTNVGNEDGYNWRKYGQKQVKGSEYPRSYYKCTHPNCPVKKKVERSHEGHITEIIYKGAHNHPKPPSSRRSAIGSSNTLSDMQHDITEQSGAGVDGDPVWTTMKKGTAAGASDWRHENLDVTSAVGPDYGNTSTTLQAQNGAQFESSDVVDRSSNFSNEEGDDDRATHGSASLDYDGEGDESESKRRKVEAYANEVSGATRAIREPRVVVQTTSEVDILDDGYRWRKYGQKVVKGNPNPRSYYKCTNAGCNVRKHVERASHDLKSVITTYEGKHNHDVPAARNSSNVNSGVSNSMPSQSSGAVQTQAHRPEPSQVQNNMARFERPHSLGSFGLPGMQQQMGPSHGFVFGMNQPGLANLGMAGLCPNQGKMPVHHPYFGQPRAMSDMGGFMLPKGEPKAEPVSEPGLNLNNGSSVYHQLMSRLPLGPQM